MESPRKSRKLEISLIFMRNFLTKKNFIMSEKNLLFNFLRSWQGELHIDAMWLFLIWHIVVSEINLLESRIFIFGRLAPFFSFLVSLFSKENTWKFEGGAIGNSLSIKNSLKGLTSKVLTRLSKSVSSDTFKVLFVWEDILMRSFILLQCVTITLFFAVMQNILY